MQMANSHDDGLDTFPDNGSNICSGTDAANDKSDLLSLKSLMLDASPTDAIIPLENMDKVPVVEPGLRFASRMLDLVRRHAALTTANACRLDQYAMTVFIIRYIHQLAPPKTAIDDACI
jgi:hypothetical protein